MRERGSMNAVARSAGLQTPSDLLDCGNPFWSSLRLCAYTTWGTASAVAQHTRWGNPPFTKQTPQPTSCFGTLVDEISYIPSLAGVPRGRAIARKPLHGCTQTTTPHVTEHLLDKSEDPSRSLPPCASALLAAATYAATALVASALADALWPREMHRGRRLVTP